MNFKRTMRFGRGGLHLLGFACRQCRCADRRKHYNISRMATHRATGRRHTAHRAKRRRRDGESATGRHRRTCQLDGYAGHYHRVLRHGQSRCRHAFGHAAESQSDWRRDVAEVWHARHDKADAARHRTSIPPVFCHVEIPAVPGHRRELYVVHPGSGNQQPVRLRQLWAGRLGARDAQLVVEPRVRAGANYAISKHWSVGTSVNYMPVKTNLTLYGQTATGTQIVSKSTLRLNPLSVFLNVAYTF